MILIVNLRLNSLIHKYIVIVILYIVLIYEPKTRNYTCIIHQYDFIIINGTISNIALLE